METHIIIKVFAIIIAIVNIVLLWVKDSYKPTFYLTFVLIDYIALQLMRLLGVLQ